jgi:type IV pilus assembly protein PilA
VPRKPGQAGISVIEPLIVVAILLVVAAIAIPNLLRARIAANESSVVNSIRTYTTANVNIGGQAREDAWAVQISRI